MRCSSDEAIYRSIHTAANGRPIHEALSDAPPGIVDLWDLAGSDESRTSRAGRRRSTRFRKPARKRSLPRASPTRSRDLIDRQEPTGRADKRRPIRPGDILILVRRRGKLFDAMLQGLKRAHVPVAGADRLKLTEHIAIIDLMSLADAILLPTDDLSLAVALKSPLFGMTEDQLFKLAHGRNALAAPGTRRARKHRRRIQAAHDRLVACEAIAADASPFAFYSWLLGSDRGRSRILGRLSHEANDALDEFLELALRYEQREAATLQGFMAWLRATDIEIKRDMEISRDEVRVMTVHGAKGLEAPVVFLMDTTSTPLDNVRLSLDPLPVRDRYDRCRPNAWCGRAARPTIRDVVRDARQRMVDEIEHEYRRLLYVAMTRAAERLIVGGVQPGNRKDVPPGSWYELITAGLQKSGSGRAQHRNQGRRGAALRAS